MGPCPHRLSWSRSTAISIKIRSSRFTRTKPPPASPRSGSRPAYDVTTGVGGTGVVAVLKNGPGPTLMLRTDLDALPVTEATDLTYASTARSSSADGRDTGVMHACGHDIHMTNLVGVAQYLAEPTRTVGRAR